MSDHRNFIFDAHTAFDLDALPVVKLTRLLRQLGERGDFARVLKAKQIALIEAHPIDQQALGLRNIGEDPEQLRLHEGTPDADEAIRALISAESGRMTSPPVPPADDAPERGLARPADPPPLMKARPKRAQEAIKADHEARQAAPDAVPDVPAAPATAMPESAVEQWEREQASEQAIYAPLPDDGAPELEQVATMLAKLLIAGRRAVDRELIAEVVRSEMARRANGWSDSD